MTGITSSDTQAADEETRSPSLVWTAFVSTALKTRLETWGIMGDAPLMEQQLQVLNKWRVSTGMDPPCRRQRSRCIFDIFTQALMRLLIITLSDFMPSDSDDIITTLNGRPLRLIAQPLQSAASFLSIKTIFHVKKDWQPVFVGRKQTNEARSKPAALERKSSVWQGDYERWWLYLIFVFREVSPYFCLTVKTLHLIKTTNYIRSPYIACAFSSLLDTGVNMAII